MTTDELIDAITGLKIFHADPPPALTHHILDKQRRTDWVKVGLLLHILNKYRRLPDGNRGFSVDNDMYNLDRQELAEKLHADPDTISEKLTGLVEDGLIIRRLRRVRTRSGKLPLRCYVAPALDKLVKVMSDYQRPPRFEVLAELETDLSTTPPSTDQLTTGQASTGQVSPCRTTGRQPVERPGDGASNDRATGGHTDTTTNRETKKQQQDDHERSEAGGAAAPAGAESAKPNSQSTETVDDPGAAPQTPVVVPSETGGVPPPGPPEDEDEPSELEKFTEFYLDWYNFTQVKGDSPGLSNLSKKETTALKALFDDYEVNALFVAATWIEAQLLAKNTAPNGYQYFACKNSSTIQGFVRNWGQVLKDIESIVKNHCSRSDWEVREALRNRLFSMNLERKTVDYMCCEFYRAKAAPTATAAPGSAPAIKVQDKPASELEKAVQSASETHAKVEERLALANPPAAEEPALEPKRKKVWVVLPEEMLLFERCVELGIKLQREERTVAVMKERIEKAEQKAQTPVQKPPAARAQPEETVAAPKAEPGVFVDGNKLSEEEARRVRSSIEARNEHQGTIEDIPAKQAPPVAAKPSVALRKPKVKGTPISELAKAQGKPVPEFYTADPAEPEPALEIATEVNTNM